MQRLLVVLALMHAAATTSRAAGDAVAPEARLEIQFGFSASMFDGVHEADARAAMKVYTQTIGDQNGVCVTREPIILAGLPAIEAELERGEVDVFALVTEEFLALEHRGLEGPFLCSNVRGRITEQYVMLVRDDSALRGPADLRDRRLIVSKDVRSSLALPWLEVACRERGLGAPSALLAGIGTASKASQAVLPVFFGQADAALVTAGSWEIMCEMNPQLRRTLRIVISSPPMVPALSCFRRGLSEAQKEQIIGAARLSSTTPAYVQLMALFKTDAVVYRPESALAETRAVVALLHRLRAEDTAGKTSAASGARGLAAGAR